MSARPRLCTLDALSALSASTGDHKLLEAEGSWLLATAKNLSAAPGFSSAKASYGEVLELRANYGSKSLESS